jgi:hypothetical protein
MKFTHEPFEALKKLILPFYESMDITPYLCNISPDVASYIKNYYRPFVAGGYVFDTLKGNLEYKDIDLYFPLLNLFTDKQDNPFIDYMNANGFYDLDKEASPAQEYSYLHLVSHPDLCYLPVQIIPHVNLDTAASPHKLFQIEVADRMVCDNLSEAFDLDVCKVAYDLKNSEYVFGIDPSEFFLQLGGKKQMTYTIKLNQLKRTLSESYVKECTYKRLYKYARKGCVIPKELELTEENIIKLLIK